MLFFERDCRDMQRLTGGNAFFRSRIRHTIAATQIEETEIEFNNQNFLLIKFLSTFYKNKLKNRVSR